MSVQTSLGSARRDTIERVWRDRWGLPIVTLAAAYDPSGVQGLILEDDSGQTLGLVTWAAHGSEVEVVTLDALVEGRGHGARLLAAAEGAIRRQGARRIVLVTTNDNLRALGLYLRRGYRLVRVHLDAMDRVRRAKPGVPTAGTAGIPLRDLWELEKGL